MQLDTSPNTNLSQLERDFGFQNLPRVRQFLAERPDLVAPLLQTYRVLDHYFAHTSAHLNVADDPDIKGYVQLILTLTVDCEPVEAVDSLNRFESEWWSKLPREICKYITLNLEFR